jgi:hypothetical protein
LGTSLTYPQGILDSSEEHAIAFLGPFNYHSRHLIDTACDASAIFFLMTVRAPTGLSLTSTAYMGWSALPQA